MTTRYKTKAFVFKKTDRNESDRVFSVFTNDFGRLDVFAKAIRKSVSKLRNGMDVFFVSDIEFIQGKNRKTLTDAVTTERFKNIPHDLDKFKIAHQIAEVLDNFIKGEEKDEATFNLIKEVFSKVDCSPANANHSLIYYYFLWNFFALQGYRSEVQKCAACHKRLLPYSIYFSSRDGGVTCKDCSSYDISSRIFLSGACRRINSDVVKIIRIILAKDWQTLSKLKIGLSSRKMLDDISNDYCFYILSGNNMRVGAEMV